MTYWETSDVTLCQGGTASRVRLASVKEARQLSKVRNKLTESMSSTTLLLKILLCLKPRRH